MRDTSTRTDQRCNDSEVDDEIVTEILTNENSIVDGSGTASRQLNNVNTNRNFESHDEFVEWLVDRHNSFNYNHIYNLILSDQWLDDDCIDAFILAGQEQFPGWSIQSVMYQEFPNLIEPVTSGESIAIIGGNCTHHWRVAHYQNNQIRIYDSLMTVERLHNVEKTYLKKRFPNARIPNYMEQMLVQQPDGNSCGVYAAAFVVDLIYGRNLSLEQ